MAQAQPITENKLVCKFRSGDLVFAKVRGYPPWPARVEDVVSATSSNIRYSIYFFGTAESAICTETNLFPYAESKWKYGKPLKAKGFRQGLEEIEEAASNWEPNEDDESGKTQGKEEDVSPSVSKLEGVKKQKIANLSHSGSVHAVQEQIVNIDEDDSSIELIEIDVEETESQTKNRNLLDSIHNAPVYTHRSTRYSQKWMGDSNSLKILERRRVFKDQISNLSEEESTRGERGKSLAESSPHVEVRWDKTDGSDLEILSECEDDWKEVLPDLGCKYDEAIYTVERTISQSSDKTSLDQILKEGLFCCHMCGLRFHDKQSLEDHWKVHSKEQRFDGKESLKDDWKVHSKEGPLTCAKCPRTFRTEETLESHMKIHVAVTCSLCKMTFNNKNGLRCHMRIHKALKCKKCKVLCSSKENLVEHMFSHAVTRPYKCGVCSRAFSKYFHLKKHVRMHAEKQTLTCEECGKAFQCKGALNRHKFSHTHIQAQKCRLCGKLFVKSNGKKPHVCVREGSNTFNCEKCRKVFKSKHKLRQHISACLIKKKLNCLKCGKMCESSKALRSHMFIHSSPYICGICNTPFINSSVLITHLRTHSNTAYNCSQCDEVFDSPLALVRHVHMNHKERFKYECEDCAKSFAVHKRLVVHMRIHNKSLECLSKCKRCGETFTERSAFLQHLKTHKKLRPKTFRCRKCRISFPTKPELDEHNQIHKRLYMCRKCGETFSERTLFRLHLKTHENSGPFTCKKCCKVFLLSSLLAEHNCAVFPKQLYICEECGKSCSTSSELAVHLESHSNSNQTLKCRYCDVDLPDRQTRLLHEQSSHFRQCQFRCFYCKESFSSHEELSEHVSTHTGVLPFQCRVCEMYFAGSGQLLNHFKIHEQDSSSIQSQ